MSRFIKAPLIPYRSWLLLVVLAHSRVCVLRVSVDTLKKSECLKQSLLTLRLLTDLGDMKTK